MFFFIFISFFWGGGRRKASRAEVTWGSAEHGGDSRAVRVQLASSGGVQHRGVGLLSRGVHKLFVFGLRNLLER